MNRPGWLLLSENSREAASAQTAKLEPRRWVYPIRMLAYVMGACLLERTARNVLTNEGNESLVKLRIAPA